MVKKKKIKLITTLICILFSVVALFAFCFVFDMSTTWRIITVLVAVSWIISGIINIVECIKK